LRPVDGDLQGGSPTLEELDVVSEVPRPSGSFAYVWQKQNVASCRDGRAVFIVPSMLTTIMTFTPHNDSQRTSL